MITYLFIFIYGLAKACSDLRLFWTDNKVSSFFSSLENPNWFLWYMGGNDKYPPHMIWTADYWHFWEHIKDLCLVAIALSVLFFPMSWWAYLPGYWFSGRVFVYFSHYALRKDPDGDFWHFMLDTIIFWKPRLKVT